MTSHYYDQCLNLVLTAEPNNSALWQSVSYLLIVQFLISLNCVFFFNLIYPNLFTYDFLKLTATFVILIHTRGAWKRELRTSGVKNNYYKTRVGNRLIFSKFSLTLNWLLKLNSVIFCSVVLVLCISSIGQVPLDSEIIS